MMADDDVLFELFKYLAAQIPELTALFAGILICVAQWRKQPRRALLAFLGFGLLLLASVVPISILIVVPRLFGDFARAEFSVIVWGCRALLCAIAYALLIAALFSGRKPLPPKPSNG